MVARRLGSICWPLLVLVTALEVFASSLARAADPVEKVVHVGFVSPQSPATALSGINAFWERLHELGWIRDQNLIVEERWAESRYDRLPALMSEVLARRVDVLVTYTTQGAIAAKNATDTVPIVVALAGDLIRSGLVTNLARPGGNLTGLSFGYAEGMAASGWNCCRIQSRGSLLWR